VETTRAQAMYTKDPIIVWDHIKSKISFVWLFMGGIAYILIYQFFVCLYMGGIGFVLILVKFVCRQIHLGTCIVHMDD